MLGTVRRASNALGASVRALGLLAGASPHEVVWRSGPARLRAYAPQGEVTGAPLLLVTPIINRFRIVDLEPGRSLVEGLTRRGIPVYAMDWGAPRRIDAGLDFEDYVLRFLPAALSEVEVRHPGAGVDVLGYCLGGTLAALFAASFPERLRRLVTLCAPVAFVDAPHMDLFRRWTQPEHFPVERLTHAFGNMPGRLILQGFLWQNPIASALKLNHAWGRFDKDGFADLFLALESWNQDSVDVPGAVYRRLIRELYGEDRLAQGTFELRGTPVDLGRIRCPVLVVAATRDTTCPPPAAKALLDLVGSERKECLDLPGGHVMPVIGPKGRARLHDPLADWLLA